MNRADVIAMDEAGLIVRNLEDPPLKDNMPVPDGGFTIFRFLADNPGYWLFHCHMSWHNHLGMGLVVKVSEGDNFFTSFIFQVAVALKVRLTIEYDAGY